MTWTKESLTELARDVFKDQYASINADLAPLDEFNVEWARTPSIIRLTFSDYIEDAPREVVADIMEDVKRKISHAATGYSESTKAWLQANIPATQGARYMQRHGMHGGAYIDLEELRPEGCTAQLCFGPIFHRDAGSSLLFNIIVICEEYDAEDTEEEIKALIEEEMENLARARDRFSRR